MVNLRENYSNTQINVFFFLYCSSLSLSHVEFFNEALFIWIVIFGMYDAFIVRLLLHVIIIKTQTFVTLADLDILFRFFGLLLRNTNKLFGFPIFRP